jgi:N-acetylglucosamine kinase-like BadF-type ATPase
MQYFLGIDTGGTKTHALIATETGEVIGFGLGGPGNHEGVGYEGVTRAILESSGQALMQAGLTIDQISGAGFGVAGYDFPCERQATLDAIFPLQLSGPLEVVNDVVIGLIAGAQDGWGIVIDSGTGNNVRGRDRTGKEGWVTGCGDTFGEYGGAGDILARAVRMVSYHWSSRGPATALSEAFVQLVGARDLTNFIEGIAQGFYTLSADNARLVFEVARQGDMVARHVIRWNAIELGETANAVIRQLQLQNEPLDVVLIGSVMKGGALFTRPLQTRIRKFAPQARFTWLQVPPVTGAVLLGMEQVGLHSCTVRHKLLQSAARFFE